MKISGSLTRLHVLSVKEEAFRGELYDDVLKTIHSVRTAALQGMQKIKGKRAVSIEGGNHRP